MQEYLMLSITRPDRDEPALNWGPGATAMVDEEEGTHFSISSIKAEIAGEVRDEPGVELAPHFPTTLIRPLAVMEADPKSADIWGVAAVQADRTHRTGEGVKVAVLDTGIDASHEAFSGVNIKERDFTGEGPGDPDGHGTHCAATILGRGDGQLQYSVAPGVTDLLVGKVLPSKGRGSTAQIAAGLQWALEEGAAVVSMSLGFDFPRYVADLQDQGMPLKAATSLALKGYRDTLMWFDALAAVAKARNQFGQGVVLVAAAGNESARTAPKPYTIDVVPPAASEHFISVGAIGRRGDSYVIAPFSNTGPSVVGPGIDIYSAMSGGGYTIMSGTSMAAPHVAGIAALWAEELIAAGEPLNARVLKAKVEGMVQGLPMKTGDIGSGLVMAPEG